MAEQYERQVAKKARIKEIEEGQFVTEEGWKPNYLLTKSGKKIARINLMGIILDKETEGGAKGFVMDDGSGKIRVRSFEEIKNMEKLQIGEGVLVVGRVRIFNEEKYIFPEIVKKVGLGWLKVRAIELGGEEEKVVVEKPREKEAEKKEEEVFEDKTILELIKSLDKGKGALIEEVKEKIGGEKVEKVIEMMLEKGDVFQNLPGRIKVL